MESPKLINVLTLIYVIRISYSTEQGVSIDATTMIKSCNVVVGKKMICAIFRVNICTYIVYIHMYKTLDILFSSNHNIHKSSNSPCFWASDPLIERF